MSAAFAGPTLVAGSAVFFAATFSLMQRLSPTVFGRQYASLTLDQKVRLPCLRAASTLASAASVGPHCPAPRAADRVGQPSGVQHQRSHRALRRVSQARQTRVRRSDPPRHALTVRAGGGAGGTTTELFTHPSTPPSAPHRSATGSSCTFVATSSTVRQGVVRAACGAR
jgi:hypothetical protein